MKAMPNPFIITDGILMINTSALDMYVRKPHFLAGRKQSKEHIENRAQKLKGQRRPGSAWNKGTLNKVLANTQKGAGNPNWKDGASTENMLIRKSKEYQFWRKQVFERDNYTCVHCGYNRANEVERRELNADHIKPFALYPELRFDVDNGRTLCYQCHCKTDTFSIKMATHIKRAKQTLVN